MLGKDNTFFVSVHVLFGASSYGNSTWVSMLKDRPKSCRDDI